MASIGKITSKALMDAAAKMLSEINPKNLSWDGIISNVDEVIEVLEEVKKICEEKRKNTGYY